MKKHLIVSILALSAFSIQADGVNLLVHHINLFARTALNIKHFSLLKHFQMTLKA